MHEVASACHAAFAECHIFSSSKSGHRSVRVHTNRDQTVLLSRLPPCSSSPRLMGSPAQLVGENCADS